jgi:pyridoxal 5'-phosphate synthase pdxT subunit
MKIGVLALQGDFAEHAAVMTRLGVQVQEVRLPGQLDDLDGLIIPGGESTTIGKLAVNYGLLEPLRAFGRQKPIWGTCAGAILLSKNAKREQPLLELMDITVGRNAFGRQTESFEVALDVPALIEIDGQDRPFPGVFIRAPLIEAVENGTRVLARLPDGRIVAAQQARLLATSFHPELVEDDRFHRYFLKLVEGSL